MIARINESKTLTNHISCKCKCKFDGRNCNPNQKWNNKCRCECKNPRKLHMCKKDHIAIQVHALVKMVNILKVLLMIQQLHAMKL